MQAQAPHRPTSSKPHQSSSSAQTVSDILSFTEGIREQFQTNPLDTGTLLEDLQKHSSTLPLPRGSLTDSDRFCLQDEGTFLWNLCTKLKWQDRDEVEKRALCYGRAFAISLLDSVQTTSTSLANGIKMMRVSLKTVRDCLDLKEFKLAMRLVRRAEFIEKDLHAVDTLEASESRPTVQGLFHELAILRLALAWQMHHPHLAVTLRDDLLSKALLLGRHQLYELAIILHDIARDAFEKGQIEFAVPWLDQCWDLISKLPLEGISDGLRRLRLDTFQLLARIHIPAKEEEGRSKAKAALDMLNLEFPDEPVVGWLNLEFISTNNEPKSTEIYDVLTSIIGRMPPVEANVNMILHRINQLKERSSELACMSIDLLLQRLIELDLGDALIEKTIVNRFWMSKSLDRARAASELVELLTNITTTWAKSLSVNATYAVLALLWKNIEDDFDKNAFANAACWCRIAQHAIFASMGEGDLAKFERRSIACAINEHDVRSARETYASMSEKGKSDLLTQYLMFKVALQDRDEELALSCFENLCRSDDGPHGNKYLFGCIFESQQSGNKHMAALILQKLLEKYDHGAPRDVHVPSLLRCTARLLVSELDNEKEETIEAICSLFEAAAHQARQSKGLSDDRTFPLNELEWFSRNSYNLALENCTIWHPSLVLRLLKSCLELMDLYPPDTPTSILMDLSFRRLLCRFLSCVLCITLARDPKNAETQLQNYLLVRSNASSLYALIPNQLIRLDPTTKADLLKKYRSVLAFDFEAAARLKAWDDLADILNRSNDVADPKLHGIFANIVLSSEAPVATKGFLLMRILNSARQQSSFTPATLSRHLRCIFQLALSSDHRVAESLLDQAVALAGNADHESENRYPAEEAEWLASTAFNVAVDFYVEGNDENARRWGGKAVEMAGAVGDGILEGLLRERFVGLGVDRG